MSTVGTGTGTAIVGAQWGSEAKGHVAQYLCSTRRWHAAVRTGGPNAGHSIYHEGRLWKMRQVPCAWIDPECILIIGPGAVMDPDLLVEEVEKLEEAGYDISSRLFVDERAGCITPEQHKHEGGTAGLAHQRIGSTGEGVGIARMARVNRRSLMPGAVLAFHKAGDEAKLEEWLFDDVTLLYGSGLKNADVMLEGTQGFHLSLTHGQWPYVTSADTTAATLCADAGFPVTKLRNVIAVARCFPIRVAGNSGPLPKETSWPILGLPEERTTVTHKVRRVAHYSHETVAQACRVNGATHVAFSGLDQLFPEVSGHEYDADLRNHRNQAVEWVKDQAAMLGLPWIMAGTGPDSRIVNRDVLESL